MTCSTGRVCRKVLLCWCTNAAVAVTVLGCMDDTRGYAAALAIVCGGLGIVIVQIAAMIFESDRLGGKTNE